MASLTIDRTSLGLEPLVIGSDPANGFWLDETGFGRPLFTARKGYAPESSDIPGQQLLTAVLDAAAIPAGVYVRAASMAALDVLMAELEAALWQFVYTVTQEVGGVSHTYTAECSMPEWGEIDPGEVAACLVRASVTIPVNPEG